MNITRCICISKSNGLKAVLLIGKYLETLLVLRTQIQILKVSMLQVVYTGKNNSYKLKLDDIRCYKHLSCNCSCFLKYAVCSHTFAYASINNLNYYDKEVKESHTFVQKTKNKKALIKDD